MTALKDKSYWSNYWATGALEACLGGDSKHSAEMIGFWTDVFQRFSQGSRVLDIATGNGFLPKLMLSMQPPLRALTVDAMDIADIQPSWYQSATNTEQIAITFKSKVAAEQLPYSDQSFDAVISQFGIEYSERQRSLPEVKRVLKPNGQVAFVVHDRDSLIVARALSELKQLEWLQQWAPYDRAQKMCRYMAMAATEEGRTLLSSDHDALQCRAEFNQFLKATQEHAKHEAYPELLFELLDAIMLALNESRRLEEASTAQARLAEIERAYADMALRLEALCRSACTEQDVLAFAEPLNLAVHRCVPLFSAEAKRIGWGVVFE